MTRIDRRLILAAPMALLAACKGPGAPAPPSGVALMEPADMTMGDPNAKVKMLEYASVACPVCAEFNNTIFGAFKAKYIDTGKVYYIHREMLTHDASIAAAGFLTARCAGKDKYFAVADTIYRRQAEIETPGADIRNILLEIGRTAGLTEAQFNQCLDNDAALEVLASRADKYNPIAQGTPAIFFNDKRVADITMAGLEKAYAEAGGT